MSPKIAIVASSIHPIKQKHLIDWYYDIKSIGLNCQLFIGSKNKNLPEAINFKINSKKEKIKYFIKGKNPNKIQPLLDYKPDIIHLLTSGGFHNILPILKNSSIITIVSFRGYDINVFPHQSVDNLKLTQEIFDKANILHFISRDLMENAIKLGANPQKCIIIYRSTIINPEDLKSIKTTNNNRLKIISVGRLVWEKGYIYALEALSILKNKQYDFEYIVVGDGIDHNMLTFHVRRLNLQKHVTFLGLVDKDIVNQLLNECDIYF